MATILAFDTATAACSVALWCNGKCSQRLQIKLRCHADLLLPMINDLLQSAALDIRDCDAIAFGCGPGSFVGLRIAVGVAQGLAYAASIPVIAISTLRALAQAAYWQSQASTILSGWDARMNQIYWGVYQVTDGYMQAVLADRLTSPAEVSVSAIDCMIAGNAWSHYHHILPSAIRQLPHCDKDCYPSAQAVAFLAAAEFNRGNVVAAESVTLSYLRGI